MQTPQTQYRGHSIVWSDNGENWYCSDISFSHEKLSKVRAKIDAMYLAMRKKSAVSCFYLENAHGSHGKPRLVDATVIDYNGPEYKTVQRNFRTESTGEIQDHSVAAMYIGYMNDRASRHKVNLSSLVPNTPEALEAFSQALEAYGAVRAASERLKTALGAIPRLSFDDVAGLAKAAEAKIDDDQQ